MPPTQSPVHITREIPPPWLIGIVVGLIVQGVTLYVGQQTQTDAIRALAVDVKELRSAAAVSGAQERGVRPAPGRSRAAAAGG